MEARSQLIDRKVLGAVFSSSRLHRASKSKLGDVASWLASMLYRSYAICTFPMTIGNCSTGIFSARRSARAGEPVDRVDRNLRMGLLRNVASPWVVAI